MLNQKVGNSIVNNMFWKKKEQYRYWPLEGDARPQNGELYRYNEPGNFIEVQS